jgi:hypothetical protein
MIFSFLSRSWPRRPRWTRSGLTVFVVVSIAAALPLAASAQSPRKTAKSPAAQPGAGEQLLNSVDDLLLDDLKIPAKSQDASSQAAKPAALPADGAADLDPELLEQLGAGEDLGQPSEDLLVTIGRRMRLAENLMGRQVTSEETQRVQRQILQDLERLIEETKKQRSGGQAAVPSPAKPGVKPSGKSRAGSGENTGVSQPAKESTDRTEGAASDDEQLTRRELLLKQMWGHLPPKIRDQMQTATVEQFLPKYERLIEAYYSRLVEEDTR